MPGDPAAGLLDEYAGSLAARSRRRTPAWWREPSACPGWSRADVLWHLATRAAAWEQALTGRPGPPAPARPEHPGELADRYAVVARDLAGALGAVRPDEPVALPERRTAAGTLAAVALGETLVHGWDLDATRPDPDAAALVVGRALAGRARSVRPAGPGGPGELLLLLTGRLGPPGRWDWEW